MEPLCSSTLGKADHLMDSRIPSEVEVALAVLTVELVAELPTYR